VRSTQDTSPLWTVFDDRSRHLDRFGPLLVLSAATIAALSLIDFREETSRTWPSVATTIASLVIGITLIVAARASGVARRWQIAIDVFVAISSVVSIAALVVALSSDTEVSVFATNRPSPIWVVLSVVTPIAIVRRLLTHRRVTARTMFGAVAAYLLIAVGFFYVFLFVDATQDAAFFVDTGDEPTTSFMYFSLVTITTLGYGDLSPATEVGRLLASTEAVIGQVYLVTFVAMFVGLFIQQRGTK
jgi:Ion channel